MNTETTDTPNEGAADTPPETVATGKPGRPKIVRTAEEQAEFEKRQREQKIIRDRKYRLEKQGKKSDGGEGGAPAAPSNPDAPKKRAGRPPSTSATPKTPTPKSDLASLAKQIEGLHQLAALGTGVSVLAISAKESEMLAKAFDDVSREYGVQISGKTAASIQLFATLGMVYGPRVVMVMGERRAKRAAAKVVKPNQEPGRSDAPQESASIVMPEYQGDTSSSLN